MSGVPATPPPGPPGSGPPSPPPFGPPYYPYPYYAAPPKRDNTPLIIVLVVVFVVLVPMVFAAILYVMVSGLLSGPTTQPMLVTFGPVDQAGGNATVPVSGASREISPSELRIRLDENTTSSGPAAMPPPDGSVPLKIGITWYRVFWLDQNHNGAFGVGDALLVTGNSAPLMPSTRYTVFLSDAGGSTISAASWTTA